MFPPWSDKRWGKASTKQGGGEISAEVGRIVMRAGRPHSGVIWLRQFPRDSYEITLEAMRLDGAGEFGSITFPLGTHECRLVVGGHDGTVVGLSQVDGTTADGNGTARHVQFEDGRWYRVRLRVRKAKIEAWIDGQKLIDFVTAGHTFSASVNSKYSSPLFHSVSTKAALRNIRYRILRLATVAERPGPGKLVRIFDGTTLRGWKVVEQFESLTPRHGSGKGGKVQVRRGRIVLEAGDPATIYQSHCGLWLGAGGDKVGLDAVDRLDPEDNTTMTRMEFEQERWYRVRLRVTEAKIQVWLDRKKLIEIERIGHIFGAYPCYKPLFPLGLFTWKTAAAVRNITLRRFGTASPQPTVGVRQGKLTRLFDGRSLRGWKVFAKGSFAGAGTAHVDAGRLILEPGDPYTGIVSTGDFPTTDYELFLEAMAVGGAHDFCNISFPVAGTHCVLRIGCLDGATIGLDKVDDKEAHENETARRFRHTKGQWYRVRLKVTSDRIEAWIDREKMVDLPTTGRRLSSWVADYGMTPLGLYSWKTKMAIRNIAFRRLGSRR
jgi:hypothetical protein